MAKKLGVQHTIARIRNPEYGVQLRFMRKELGLSMAINPESATAREIARVLRFPNAMKLESFSKGRLELVEYRVLEHTALDGIKLSDLYRNLRVRVLICAVARSGETIIPSAWLLQTAGGREDLPHRGSQGVGEVFASTRRLSSAGLLCDDCGGQQNQGIIWRLELLEMGMSVKVIDQDEQRCVSLSEKLPKALVIVGDGTDSELLNEEGIGQTDAFVAITGLDEANILMALRRRQAVPATAARWWRRSTGSLCWIWSPARA